jgi:hypothetical protein
MRVVDSFGQSDTQPFSITVTLPAPPRITTTSLPAAPITQTYNEPVLAEGTGALTFSIVTPGTGPLPPGLSLNPSTGTITGAPTTLGDFPFTVRVADTFGREDTQPLSILVSAFNAPQITTSSLPAGTVTVAYGPATLEASGGIGTLTWSIAAGSLPPGLQLDPPLTGLSVIISGTPSSQGTFDFTVRVVDSSGQLATRDLSITINLPAPPRITTTSLPAGSISQDYNEPVLAEGTGALTFSIVTPGTGPLPPGLNLNPNTGTITGAPTATGDFPFTVRVADTFGREDTEALSIHVNAFNAPQIEPASLPGGTVSAPYSPTTVQATGGIDTLTWSVSEGSLPPGLQLDPPSTGPSVTISGTPTSEGDFPFTMRVTDSVGQFDTLALSIIVTP